MVQTIHVQNTRFRWTEMSDKIKSNLRKQIKILRIPEILILMRSHWTQVISKRGIHVTLLTNPSQENSWEPEWLHQTLSKWKTGLIRNNLNLALKPSFFMCFLFWDSLHWELLFKFRFGTTASLGSWWCRDGLQGGSKKSPHLLKIHKSQRNRSVLRAQGRQRILMKTS